MDKRRVTTALGKYLVNPIVKAAVAPRLAPPSYAIDLCFNGAVVQIMGTELLTVRIDLNP
jgi:hypothetical protein